MIRGRSASPIALALVSLVGATQVAAEEGEAREPEAGGIGHWAVGAGAFVGLTGPARFGLAAEAQLYPDRWPGDVLGPHFGLGVRYRGHDGLAGGLIAAGLVYQAGATRPHFVLEVHGDLGLAYGPAEPVLGGGVRLQLGVFGPVAVAVAADVYYWFDGKRPHPITVPAVMLGLAR